MKKKPRWRITIWSCFPEDKRGLFLRRWLWSLWKNGRFFTKSSENYSRKASCVRAVQPLVEALGAEVEVHW